ncbi:hypothetical protein ANN_05267 [Periplaneta americana]|uniref:Uncharacterized protein n=1 Tax=Periplaneta americana TaxID=6978 RepID=A0ABQ8TAN2_PERAM|nr:hypothetical protein ANN_05267 [Periplaneta americana]
MSLRAEDVAKAIALIDDERSLRYAAAAAAAAAAIAAPYSTVRDAVKRFREIVTLSSVPGFCGVTSRIWRRSQSVPEYIAGSISSSPLREVLFRLSTPQISGTDNRKPGYGRKRKTTVRDDRFILLQILGNVLQRRCKSEIGPERNGDQHKYVNRSQTSSGSNSKVMPTCNSSRLYHYRNIVTNIYFVNCIVIVFVDVAKAIALIDDERSLRYAAAAAIAAPYSTVRDAVKRFRETVTLSSVPGFCGISGTDNRKPGYGRKRKTTVRDDQFILLQILGNVLQRRCKSEIGPERNGDQHKYVNRSQTSSGSN